MILLENCSLRKIRQTIMGVMVTPYRSRKSGKGDTNEAQQGKDLLVLHAAGDGRDRCSGHRLVRPGEAALPVVRSHDLLLGDPGRLLLLHGRVRPERPEEGPGYTKEHGRELSFLLSLFLVRRTASWQHAEGAVVPLRPSGPGLSKVRIVSLND